MKCKVFVGAWFEAMDAFNKWAKGKNLTRNVIIHTSITDFFSSGGYEPKMVITVYHPEGEPWDTTEPTHTKEEMIEQHIEGFKSAQTEEPIKVEA